MAQSLQQRIFKSCFKDKTDRPGLIRNGKFYCLIQALHCTVTMHTIAPCSRRLIIDRAEARG